LDKLESAKNGMHRLAELFATPNTSKTNNTSSNVTTQKKNDPQPFLLPPPPPPVNSYLHGGVVRLRRNLLDVYLSRLKHSQFKQQHYYSHLQSHCTKSDVTCQTAHAKAATSSTTSNTNSSNDSVGSTIRGRTIQVEELLVFLYEWTASEDKVDEYLRQYSVPTVFVTYENLYYPWEQQQQQQQRQPQQGPPKESSSSSSSSPLGTTAATAGLSEEEGRGTKWAAEWNKIFQFLQWQPPVNLTFDMIQNATPLAATTTSRRHRDEIANYDEIFQALQGTPFETLLRD
jgi:hypothetical protein